MSNYAAKSVDEYIQMAPEEAQPHLKQLRKIVKSAIPEVEEKISYGKPYYRYHGMLGGFDVYSKHIGFEIWRDKLTEEERKHLESLGYKTGSRTFQIKFDQNVPAEIIKTMLLEQAKFNQEKEKAKKK